MSLAERDSGPKAQDFEARVGRLLFLRVAVATFLLGVAAVIQVSGGESYQGLPITGIFSVILFTYLVSIAAAFGWKVFHLVRINIVLQVLCDILLITALVYLTGGIRSLYSILYPLVIIYATLFLSLGGGLSSAALASVCFGLLLAGEQHGLIHPVGGVGAFDFSTGVVWARIFMYAGCFHMVALLTSLAVQEERRSRSLLAARQSDFDRLDRLHRSIVESVTSGIVTLDPALKIKSMNRAAEGITGIDRRVAQDRNVDEVLPGLGRVLAGLDADGAAPPTVIRRGELELACGAPPEPRLLGYSMAPLAGSEGDPIGLIVIFQDLTAIKAMEGRVENSRRLALIGEMAAGFAHEIRNPLASLSGSVQMLQQRLELDDTSRRLMEIVMRGRAQLEKLVQDFMLLARARVEPRLKVDVERVLQETLEALEVSPEWHDGVRVEKDFGGQARVWGGEVEIRQILWNLMLNALQAMPLGGVLRLATCRLGENEGPARIAVRIEDTGIGIAAAEGDKIFTPFYTTRDKGTGLGLVIASRIAESLEGRISWVSRAGEGTAFTVELPAAETALEGGSRAVANLEMAVGEHVANARAGQGAGGIR